MKRVKCCYCKQAIKGRVPYRIPEDVPINRAHEKKPLCKRCGGSSLPTLDDICGLLDAESFRDEIVASLKVKP